jgi:hypothetical protein
LAAASSAWNLVVKCLFSIFLLTLFTGAPGERRFSGRTGLGFYRLLHIKLLDCFRGKSKGF